MTFNKQQRAKMACWYDNCHSLVVVQRKFKAKYGKNSIPPSAATIKKWHMMLMSSGQVTDSRRKRSSTATSEKKKKEVMKKFADNPHRSLRSVSRSMGISHESVRRILANERWHPYKMITVKKLFDSDNGFRPQFAEAELKRQSKSSSHLEFLTFSDEAHFHLDGLVHRHNFRYWAPNNPNWVTEIPLHSPKTTVWAAIGRQGLFGPFFFSETVNSDRYLTMLKCQFWPLLKQRSLENNLIFMQCKIKGVCSKST